MNCALLANTLLFRGMTQNEIQAMLGCLGAYTKRYAKGEVIFRAGEAVSGMGLVMSGGVNIESDDVWGNKSILSHIAPGQIFAESYACIPGEPLMVNAAASERSEVLFVDMSRLLTPCAHCCAHHNKLIKNLLQSAARKNLDLSRRSLHTSPKTIRGRLLAYLSDQARACGSYQFSIPFNRQQLADYLGVDRSAMSNELSKMQAEGILACRKSEFRLKETGE